MISLSGGLDSLAVLEHYIAADFNEYHCVFFKYPSKHNLRELKAVQHLISYYENKHLPIYFHIIDVTDTFSNFNSALLQGKEHLPEVGYNKESMQSTVVPCRNFIFASIMAGAAESLGIQEIALGVHSGDHYLYPDCRPEFIYQLQSIIYIVTDRKVRVTAPLLHETKADIVKFLHEKDAPMHLTRSCYSEGELSCGICGTCRERLDAFAANNLTDPIQYK